MNEKYYKIGEFSKMIRVTVKTLQNWDNLGILVAYRNVTNRRFYTYSQYLEYLEKLHSSKL